MNKIWLSFLFCICMVATLHSQKIAIKSNIVYDATATLNLGVEYAITPNMSIDLSGNYNGWDVASDGKSWQHYMIQPEFRYWIHESFNGHFLGVHAMYIDYNIARMELPLFDFSGKNIYDGNAYGGGISYGYQLYITPRLNVEFSIGAGYVSMEYDKFKYNRKEGENEKLGRFTKGYFGPTKLGISIVYIIN